MIGLSIHSLSLFFLISIRLGAIILFSPLEVIRRLPVQIRLLLLFLSSFLIILNIDAPFQAESLAAAFAAELINSQLFYLSLSACIGCFQIAGHLIDIQNGLNGVSVFKPDAGFDSLSAHLLGMMAALFFFASQGHHKFIRLILVSFAESPPGKLIGQFDLLHFIKQFAMIWSLGLLIASPVVFCLWLVEVCSGVLSRNMPQVSPFFLILPVKILLGFLVFYLLLDNINPLLQKTFELGFECWRGYLHD